MKIGDVLRKYRRVNDMDLRTQAKVFGIGAATLMRLEQGYDPAGKTLAKIMKWLLS